MIWLHPRNKSARHYLNRNWGLPSTRTINKIHRNRGVSKSADPRKRMFFVGFPLRQPEKTYFLRANTAKDPYKPSLRRSGPRDPDGAEVRAQGIPEAGLDLDAGARGPDKSKEMDPKRLNQSDGTGGDGMGLAKLDGSSSFASLQERSGTIKVSNRWPVPFWTVPKPPKTKGVLSKRAQMLTTLLYGPKVRKRRCPQDGGGPGTMGDAHSCPQFVCLWQYRHTLWGVIYRGMLCRGVCVDTWRLLEGFLLLGFQTARLPPCFRIPGGF